MVFSFKQPFLFFSTTANSTLGNFLSWIRIRIEKSSWIRIRKNECGFTAQPCLFHWQNNFI